MGQISEGSTDAQNVAKTLVEAIVGEVIKTVHERTEPHFDSFYNLKLQSLGNEDILECVKSEGMSLDEIKKREDIDQGSINEIGYQNLPELSSTLSTQGEGDFQPPFVRETKAFYQLESEDVCCSDRAGIDSCHSSVNTSLTEELIAQLHVDINNISFDNINLSDSEVERELSITESSREETKTQVNQCCQTSSMNNLEDDLDSVNEQYHELRHSPKFSHLNELLNQYFRVNENCDEKGQNQKCEFLSASPEECPCLRSRREGSIDNSSQTNPFTNPFLCSNVNSTIALSSDCCELRDRANMSSESTALDDVRHNKESNEWVEANEVQLMITEPGCSKDFLQAESVEVNASPVQSRQYWSNVGLITEHSVDRRYMGPVDVPGIEMIPGVPRVQEKYLTGAPEKIIWVSEAESLEKGTLTSSKENPMDNEGNYLTYPEKTGEKIKKKKFVSRLTKAISSIFKINSKDSINNKNSNSNRRITD